MKHVEFSIPAIQGFQGGHICYVAMCPIQLLPRLFPIGVDDSTDSSHQSFRQANLNRVRETANEIIANRHDFHIAAVTISIENEVRFVAFGSPVSKSQTMGDLHVPLEARLTILDGIHRIYGLQRALAECPDLASNTIAMLIHIDPEGFRRGQIFSDVKRHERSTAKSLRIGFDERDEIARLTRGVISAVPIFVGAIEMEKTAISNRSRKLFTLSALYQANSVLLADRKRESYSERLALATEFWTEVATQIPGWSRIVNGDTSAAELRASFVHCHAIGIAAIARAGRALLLHPKKAWKKRLTNLSTLDWSRSNTVLWEGRAMIGGRLSKSSSAVARTANAVKRHLGLELTRDEQALEN